MLKVIDEQEAKNKKLDSRQLDFDSKVLNIADIYRAIQSVVQTPEDVLIDKIKQKKDITAQWQNIQPRLKIIPTF